MMKTSDSDLLTIGRLAALLGIAPTTLRYYERVGLLAPSSRSSAGYRLYGPAALDRLRFIRAAQAAGFSLEDIRARARLERGEGAACRAEVERLLDRRLAQVDDKLESLGRVRDALARSRDRCRRSDGTCAVMKELNQSKTTRS